MMGEAIAQYLATRLIKSGGYVNRARKQYLAGPEGRCSHRMQLNDALIALVDYLVPCDIGALVIRFLVGAAQKQIPIILVQTMMAKQNRLLVTKTVRLKKQELNVRYAELGDPAKPTVLLLKWRARESAGPCRV